MKSKTWIGILAGLLVICLGLSLLLLLPGREAQLAEVWSDGKRIRTVSLLTDQEFTVEHDGGVNVIRVQDGRIAVSSANCPDQHCVHRGYLNSGAQIVCLPNRLVIKFVSHSETDGVSG